MSQRDTRPTFATGVCRCAIDTEIVLLGKGELNDPEIEGRVCCPLERASQDMDCPLTGFAIDTDCRLLQEQTKFKTWLNRCSSGTG
jgi:hypothetical protein